MSDRRALIDCRRAHELLSQQMDAPLRLADRVRLKVHLAVCSFCVRVGRQFQALRDATRRLGS